MGTYIRLVDYGSQQEKENAFLSVVNGTTAEEIKFNTNEANFSKIPGSPIAYWVSEKLIKALSNDIVGLNAELTEGVHTRDNECFLRLWHEVSMNKSALLIFDPTKKWFAYNKGGNYRKWYGNNEHVINWENNGEDVKQFKKSTVGKSANYFTKGITFTLVTSIRNSFRYSPDGFIYDVSGPTLYLLDNSDIYYYLSFFISTVSLEILKIFNSTISLQIRDIKQLPIIESKKNKEHINKLALDSIVKSRFDWDSFETSWDFKRNPLI